MFSTVWQWRRQGVLDMKGGKEQIHFENVARWTQTVSCDLMCEDLLVCIHIHTPVCLKRERKRWKDKTWNVICGYHRGMNFGWFFSTLYDQEKVNFIFKKSFKIMKYKCMDITLVLKYYILNGCQVGESSNSFFWSLNNVESESP